MRTLLLAELTGYALPMDDLPADHTYVVSSAGNRWDCKGRSQGGRIICRGFGNLRLVRCLVCSDGRAGIIYGITGVCHQMANRMLFPTGVRVEQARGYNTSFRYFGHFGLDLGRGAFWPERRRCLDQLSHSELHEEAAGWFDGLREPEAAYVMQADHFVEQSVLRINLLLDRELAGALDRGVRARVEQIVAGTAAKQRELVLAFENGEITPQTYLSEFNQLVASDFRRLDEALGRDAFVAVFGAPPDAAAKMIDPKVFAAEHGVEVPDEDG